MSKIYIRLEGGIVCSVRTDLPGASLETIEVQVLDCDYLHDFWPEADSKTTPEELELYEYYKGLEREIENNESLVLIY